MLTKTRVTDNFTVWFTHSTPVAFEAHGVRTTTNNEWGRDIGEAIDRVGVVGNRLGYDDFVQAYDTALAEAIVGLR